MTRHAGEGGVPGWRRATALAVVVLAGLSGCADDAETSRVRTASPPPAPVVSVVMREYRFDHDDDVPAGRVVLRFTNEGTVAHRVTMIRLPDDVPPIDVQLRGSERRSVPPFAGIYERAPGDIGTFAVDLEPATRYAFICSVRAPDGTPHWQKGMTSEFRTPPG